MTRNKVFKNNTHPTSPLWEAIVLLSSCPTPQMAKALTRENPIPYSLNCYHTGLLPSLFLRETQELHSVAPIKTSFKNTVWRFCWQKAPGWQKGPISHKKSCWAVKSPFCSFLIYFSRVEHGTGTTESQRPGKTLPSFMPYIPIIIKRHRPSHQLASTTICVHSTRAVVAPEHHSNVIASTLWQR